MVYCYRVIGKELLRCLVLLIRAIDLDWAYSALNTRIEYRIGGMV